MFFYKELQGKKCVADTEVKDALISKHNTIGQIQMKDQGRTSHNRKNECVPPDFNQ